MWHYQPTKSFLPRAIIFCLLVHLLLGMGQTWAQSQATRPVSRKVIKQRLGQVWQQIEDSLNYDLAARLLAENRAQLDEGSAWEVDSFAVLVAYQWYMEGLLARYQRKWPEGIEKQRVALTHFDRLIAERGDCRSDHLNVLLELGILYDKIREPAECIRYNQAAKALLEKFLREGVSRIDSSEYAFVHTGMANLYRDYASLDGKNHPGAENPNLVRAIHHYQSCLDIRLAAGKDRVGAKKISLSYMNLSEAQVAMGDIAEARRLLELARPYVEEDLTEHSYWYLDRGNLDLLQGEPEAAYANFQKARDLRKMGIADAGYVTEPDYHLARAALEMEDFPRAEGHLEIVDSILTEADGVTPRPFYEADFIKVLNLKAEFLRRKGVPDQALATYTRAAEIARLLRSNARSEQAKLNSGGRDLVLTPHREGMKLALRRYGETEDLKYFARAFYFSEKLKAILLYQLLQRNGFLRKVAASLPEKERAEFAALRDLDRQIKVDYQLREAFYERKNALLNQKVAGSEIARLDQKLDELGDKIMQRQKQRNAQEEKLLRDWEEHYPDQYAQLASVLTLPDPIELAAVSREILNHDSVALLSYSLERDHLTIIGLTAQERYFKSFPLYDQFYADLDSVIRICRRPPEEVPRGIDEVAIFQTAATNVYHTLIGQMENWLQAQGAKRLIVIPDGQLGYLSFEALLRPAPRARTYYDLRDYFLAQQYAFSYESSATVLHQRILRHRELGDKHGVAVFAPSRFNGMTSLRNIEDAAREIAEATGDNYFEAEAATKTEFQRRANDFGIVIAATHSIANDSFPGRSVLLLGSDPTASPNNDSLFAADLYNMALNLKHLFLASCETGRGELRRGEGILSLSRAITASGCASTTSSLWKVPDESVSTGQIMERYFGGLSRNQPKDVALNAAKRMYLASDHNNFFDYRPYNWAEFTIYGDISPTPIKWKKPFRVGTSSALVLLLLLGISGAGYWVWVGRKRDNHVAT